MTSWRDDYIEALSRAPSEDALFERLTSLAHALGFEHCSFGMRLPIPISKPRFSLYSDYPEGWVRQYVSNNYFSVDPTVLHGLTQISPLTWAADHPFVNPTFWEEASLHGLRHGWCMPSHGRHGTIALLSLVRSGERITPEELDAKEARMIWLSMLTHSAMSEFLTPKLMPECAQQLTAREKEVLKWTAAGKTYIEIGIILALDERTVKFHLVNAMRKLNASNKTEAAFKASMLGMLG